MADKISVYTDNRKIVFLTPRKFKSVMGKKNRAHSIDRQLIRQFLNEKGPYLYHVSSQPKIAFHQFAHFFYQLEAAGGLVINERKDLLLIFRNGRWDLPKGILEPGEDFASAALREVTEECGITDICIANELPATYHVYYHQKHRWALKTTKWFLMLHKADEKPLPQYNEGITKVEWRKSSQLSDIMENTYGNIKDLLVHYLQDPMQYPHRPE